jgi:hypothetical protein
MKRTAPRTKKHASTSLGARLELQGRDWIEAQYAKEQAKLAAMRKRRSSSKSRRDPNRLAGKESIDAEYVKEQAVAEVQKRRSEDKRSAESQTLAARVPAEASGRLTDGNDTPSPVARSRVKRHPTATIRYKSRRRNVEGRAENVRQPRPLQLPRLVLSNVRRKKKNKRKKSRVSPEWSSWRPTLSWSVPDTFLSSGLNGSKWSIVRGGRPLRGGLPGLGKRR